jgi:hypothetical protein
VRVFLAGNRGGESITTKQNATDAAAPEALLIVQVLKLNLGLD